MIKSASPQGATLTELYQHYNSKWFGGELPPYTVRQDLTGTVEAGRCDRAKREIHLHESLNGGETISVLLHEMCHVRVCGIVSHGTDFVNELRRLVQAGETCLEKDLARYGNALAANFAKADRACAESQRRITGRIGRPTVKRGGRL